MDAGVGVAQSITLHITNLSRQRRPCMVWIRCMVEFMTVTWRRVVMAIVRVGVTKAQAGDGEIEVCVCV